MIEKFKVVNEYGYERTFLLAGAESDILPVTNIDGLGPVAGSGSTTDYASMNGAIINGVSVSSRNIVITCYLADPDTSRKEMYRVFPTGSEVTIYFYKNDNEFYTTGVVESLSVDYFGDMEGAQVSVLCGDPYFYDVSSLTNLNTDGEYTAVFMTNGNYGYTLSKDTAARDDTTYYTIANVDKYTAIDPNMDPPSQSDYSTTSVTSYNGSSSATPYYYFKGYSKVSIKKFANNKTYYVARKVYVPATVWNEDDSYYALVNGEFVLVQLDEYRFANSGLSYYKYSKTVYDEAKTPYDNRSFNSSYTYYTKSYSKYTLKYESTYTPKIWLEFTQAALEHLNGTDNIFYDGSFTYAPGALSTTELTSVKRYILFNNVTVNTITAKCNNLNIKFENGTYSVDNLLTTAVTDCIDESISKSECDVVLTVMFDGETLDCLATDLEGNELSCTTITDELTTRCSNWRTDLYTKETSSQYVVSAFDSASDMYEKIKLTRSTNFYTPTDKGYELVNYDEVFTDADDVDNSFNFVIINHIDGTSSVSEKNGKTGRNITSTSTATLTYYNEDDTTESYINVGFLRNNPRLKARRTGEISKVYHTESYAEAPMSFGGENNSTLGKTYGFRFNVGSFSASSTTTNPFFRYGGRTGYVECGSTYPTLSISSYSDLLVNNCISMNIYNGIVYDENNSKWVLINNDIGCLPTMKTGDAYVNTSQVLKDINPSGDGYISTTVKRPYFTNTTLLVRYPIYNTIDGSVSTWNTEYIYPSQIKYQWDCIFVNDGLTDEYNSNKEYRSLCMPEIKVGRSVANTAVNFSVAYLVLESWFDGDAISYDSVDVNITYDGTFATAVNSDDNTVIPSQLYSSSNGIVTFTDTTSESFKPYYALTNSIWGSATLKDGVVRSIENYTTNSNYFISNDGSAFTCRVSDISQYYDENGWFFKIPVEKVTLTNGTQSLVIIAYISVVYDPSTGWSTTYDASLPYNYWTATINGISINIGAIDAYKSSYLTTAETYYVTYNSDYGDTIPENEYVTCGYTPANCIDLSNTVDYAFVGWYYDSLYTEPYNEHKAVFSNTNLYAKWLPINVTVNVHYLGLGDDYQYTVLYGNTASVPIQLDDTIYTTVGWYSTQAAAESSSTNVLPYNFNTPVYEELDLYVRAHKTYVTLTVDYSGVHEETTQSVLYGTRVTYNGNDKLVDYSDYGDYKVYGLYLNADYSGTKYDPTSSALYLYDDTKYYVRYVPKYVTITYNNGGIINDISQTIEYESKISNPNYITETDTMYAEGVYTDSGYTTEANLDSLFTANTTLYVKWENKVQFTYSNIDGAGDQNVTDYVIPGNSYTLRTFSSIPGYEFISVTDNGSIVQYTSITANIDKIYSVNWIEHSDITITQLYFSSGYGLDDTLPQLTVPWHSIFTNSNGDRTGYTYDGAYYGNLSDSSKYESEALDQNTTLYLNYVANTYTVNCYLTLDFDRECKASNVISVNATYGSTVTLPAYEDFTYSFANEIPEEYQFGGYYTLTGTAIFNNCPLNSGASINYIYPSNTEFIGVLEWTDSSETLSITDLSITQTTTLYDYRHVSNSSAYFNNVKTNDSFTYLSPAIDRSYPDPYCVIILNNSDFIDSFNDSYAQYDILYDSTMYNVMAYADEAAATINFDTRTITTNDYNYYSYDRSISFLVAVLNDTSDITATTATIRRYIINGGTSTTIPFRNVVYSPSTEEEYGDPKIIFTATEIGFEGMWTSRVHYVEGCTNNNLSNVDSSAIEGTTAQLIVLGEAYERYDSSGNVVFNLYDGTDSDMDIIDNLYDTLSIEYMYDRYGESTTGYTGPRALSYTLLNKNVGLLYDARSYMTDKVDYVSLASNQFSDQYSYSGLSTKLLANIYVNTESCSPMVDANDYQYGSAINTKFTQPTIPASYYVAYFKYYDFKISSVPYSYGLKVGINPITLTPDIYSLGVWEE